MNKHCEKISRRSVKVNLSYTPAKFHNTQ